MATPLPDTDSEDELPPGWEERTTEDGKIYYANHADKRTQWTHPKSGKKKKIAGEMPHGWEKKVDAATGNIIYVDHINHKTSLTDPRLAFAVDDEEDTGLIRQRFDGSSTGLQIVIGRDLSNKTAIITGANTGIGFETARSLALHGCHVIMACRNMKRGEEALNRLKLERESVRVEVMECDLSRLKSVKMFVDNYKMKQYPLNILVLNAAVFGHPFQPTEDGFETTFQVNHLAHFYLTVSLGDVLMASSRPKSMSRVIVVSSEGHRYSQLSAKKLTDEVLSPSTSSHYTAMFAYNNSKLLNILFSNELNNRWRYKGVSSNSLHPGSMVNTDISRHWWVWRMLFTLVRPFTKSLQQGAASSVYTAVASELEGVGGMYFNNCRVCEPHDLAKDAEMGRKLWDISEKMVEKLNR